MPIFFFFFNENMNFTGQRANIRQIIAHLYHLNNSLVLPKIWANSASHTSLFDFDSETQQLHLQPYKKCTYDLSDMKMQAS